jgi:rhodanese-related sulfurtransferase
MTVQTISPSELQSLIRRGTPIDLIDVRSPREYESIHASSARLVPLDELDANKIVSSRGGASNEPIYLICAKGSRGAKACEKFLAAGFSNVFNVAGGTDAWAASGLPVVRGRGMISLERQFRITVGSIILLGVLLGFLVHPILFGLSAFAGAGLIFAGITDICPMAMLIARMPWNKSCAGGACAVSPSH